MFKTEDLKLFGNIGCVCNPSPSLPPVDKDPSIGSRAKSIPPNSIDSKVWSQSSVEGNPSPGIWNLCLQKTVETKDPLLQTYLLLLSTYIFVDAGRKKLVSKLVWARCFKAVMGILMVSPSDAAPISSVRHKIGDIVHFTWRKELFIYIYIYYKYTGKSYILYLYRYISNVYIYIYYIHSSISQKK